MHNSAGRLMNNAGLLLWCKLKRKTKLKIPVPNDILPNQHLNTTLANGCLQVNLKWQAE